MARRRLRVIYAFEFLLAVIAVFTAWPEIGGQALDLMHWSWKGGLAIALAASIVGFTAALNGSDNLWTLRSARWFMAVLVCLLLAGLVTYYYSLQVDAGDSEDGGSLSTIERVVPPRCLTV